MDGPSLNEHRRAQQANDQGERTPRTGNPAELDRIVAAPASAVTNLIGTMTLIAIIVFLKI